MNHDNGRLKGFTLLEIIIVIVIVAILALIAMLQYSKTMEMNRADQAVALLRQVAAANHMYSLDNTVGAPSATCSGFNSGNYPSGQITNACNLTSVNCLGNQNDATPCDLVACGYLPKRDWNSLPYNVYALNPTDTPSSVCTTNITGFPATSSFPGTTCYIACVARNSGSNGSAPYNGWGYALYYSTDTISAVGGAPSP